MSMPAAKSDDGYIVSHADWRVIGLEIRHCVNWCAMVGMDHIEVISAERVPLPITETGYKSLFIPPERIAEFGSATDYVLAWLDHAAEAESWKGREAEARQLSLF